MRTATYAIEPHPDAPYDLGAFGVTFHICELCGALVHDDLLHGTWHDRMDAATTPPTTEGNTQP